MSRTIGILAGKGGVGKTTLTANLGYALTELGNKVTLVDANLTTPHLGFHLGMHLVPKTLHDVLRGYTSVRNATYVHPLGFKVIPGSISVKDLVNVDIAKLSNVTSHLSDKSDFILLDCAPSLGREAITALQATDEVLIVTNPDLPSVADALKTLKFAQKTGKIFSGAVLNRVKWGSGELKKSEVEEILGSRIIAEIPEDKNVPKSIAAKTPVLDFSTNSPASTEIRRLAHHLVGKEYNIRTNYGFLDWLVGWMTK
ncbi:MAG: AAA family ATPase [Candidatus Aenigmarchaeota archaeon]|nr:AAA family ATPase [Candidatus Aenigmarchaeota archaeon]